MCHQCFEIIHRVPLNPVLFIKNSFLERDNASSLYKKALGGLAQFKDEREWTRTDVMARSTKKINTRVQIIAIVENYTLHFLFFAINFVRYADFLSFLLHFENYHPEKNHYDAEYFQHSSICQFR